MHIAVTGATGMLGRAIAIDLRNNGHAVTGLSRSLQPETTKIDLTDRNSVLDAIDGVDVVVHAAGKVGAQNHDDVNHAMAETLGRAVADTYPVIHLSSVAVYGHASSAVITEETPCDPASDYGRSKLKAEKALQEHASTVCHLRIANVLSQDQIHAVAKGRRPRLIRANEMCNLVLVADVTSLVRHLCSIEADLWPDVVNVVHPELGQMRYRQLLPSQPPLNMVQRVAPRQAAHLIRRLRRTPSLPNRTFASTASGEIGFQYEPADFTLHRNEPWITFSPRNAPQDNLGDP